MRFSVKALCLLFSAIACLCFPDTANAQQPLAQFLQEAQSNHPDMVEARIALQASKTEASASRHALGPTLDMSARYHLNYPETEFLLPGEADPVVIVPRHQVDASASLRVPLIDSGAWARIKQADSSKNASRYALAATQLQSAEVVTTLWYALVARREILRGAHAVLESAREDFKVTTSRTESGLASQLDLHRSEAEVAGAQRDIADAELREVLASRDLEAATGLVPDHSRVELRAESFPEHPKNYWLERLGGFPKVREAEATRLAAVQERKAKDRTLLPLVSGIAEVRSGNASGFGAATSAAIGVELKWQIDFANLGRTRSPRSAVDLAAARTKRARRDAETSILNAFYSARSYDVAARAAEVAMKQHAASVEVARARYRAGTGRQIDVVTARRDYQRSEIDHIRVLADLAVARASLRLRSGRRE